MKKCLVILVLISACHIAVSQTSCAPGAGVTCTPNLNLWQLPLSYPSWNTPTNANFGAIDSLVLLKSGGTMSGVLTNPSGFVGPLTGNVIGNLTGTFTGTVNGHATLDLPLTGGTLSGSLTNASGFIGPVTGNVVGNLTGNVTGSSSLNVLKAGDTMTGSLTDASGFIGPLTGNVTGNLTGSVTGNVTGSASLNLLLSGGTLSGTLNGTSAIFSATVSAATGIQIGGVTIINSGKNIVGATSLQIGAGIAMTGNQGNGLLIQHSTGATTTNDCAKFDANGNVVDNGSACGGGGSGDATSIQGNAVAAGAATLDGQTYVWNAGASQFQLQSTSAVLPSASINKQAVWVDTSGIGSVATEGNTEINVVYNRAVDNSGGTDAGTPLQTILNGVPANQPPTVYLPAGIYQANGGIKVNCTSSTCNGIHLKGAGGGQTYIQSNCSGQPYILWLNNTTNSGDNFNGPIIEGIQLQDTSGTGACRDGLRLTQIAHFIIRDVPRIGFKGNTYSTGTIAISGSTVTGTGTTFTSAMVPGVLQIAGIMAEVCTFGSATSLTLCDTGWPAGNQTAGKSYALANAGRAMTFDPGFSFTQYGSVWDSFGTGNLFDFYSMGTNGGGNSRISIQGNAGWSGIAGSRVANSVGYWLGKHSDTFLITSPTNFHSRCWVMDSAHANKISGDCESNSTYPIVTTCNGGVASQACVFGAEISADTPTSTSYGNDLTDAYVYLAGTAFVVDNSNAQYSLSIKGLRAASFSNTNTFSFSGVTGCPLPGSGVLSSIDTFDCYWNPLNPQIPNISFSTATSLLNALTCTGYTATSMPGVKSTSSLSYPTPNADNSAANGWGLGGTLYFSFYPTTDTFNWKVCNGSPSTAVTPGAVTWNESAR